MLHCEEFVYTLSSKATLVGARDLFNQRNLANTCDEHNSMNTSQCYGGESRGRMTAGTYIHTCLFMQATGVSRQGTGRPGEENGEMLITDRSMPNENN